MSKKDKELKKLKKGKDKEKKKKKVKLQECEQPVFRRNSDKELVFIVDENLSLEERVYAIPYDLSYNFEQNRIHQLKEAGLYDKYNKQLIITTYVGTICNPYNVEDYMNYVGEITDDIRRDFLNKNYVHVSYRSDVEYSPRTQQYVGVVIVTSKNYVLLLEAIEGRLKGKYTMVQGHVDYDSSFVYLPLESFIAKNAYRELIEEVKFEDGSELPVENMNTEASFIVNKTETLIDIEHLGLVYQYEMSDEDIVKLVSAEPEKHNVVLMPKAEIHNEENMGKYDSWLSSVINLIKK